MIELLKKLCDIDGTSSREQKVADFVRAACEGHDVTTDPLGNVIVNVKGKQRAKNKVMICAHMDEVGVMATYVMSDGLIKFITVGGIQTAVLAGRTVRFENGTVGTIGIKPVHLCTPEEKTALPEAESLYIDIGAKDKADALQYVQPGDTAVFTSEFVTMDDKILSKAIDDRAGCAVMLDMIHKGVQYDTTFVFNVQEEVGLRGSSVSAFGVDPDYAIVLEGTTAADLIDSPEDKRVCILGKGAAVSFMDRATVYDPALFRTAFEVAEANGIPVQAKTMVAGGNDAGSIHKARGGIRTITVNVPTRYIHSASCLCDKNDLFAARALAEKLAERFANE